MGRKCAGRSLRGLAHRGCSQIAEKVLFARRNCTYRRIRSKHQRWPDRIRLQLWLPHPQLRSFPKWSAGSRACWQPSFIDLTNDAYWQRPQWNSSIGSSCSLACRLSSFFELLEALRNPVCPRCRFELRLWAESASPHPNQQACPLNPAKKRL